MINGYAICGTPRTGSTLLCQYLKSTKLAGIPESYFRKEDMYSFAKTWQILRSDGTYNFADYLAATCAAGSTKNGALAIRIMWGTLDEMTLELGKLYTSIYDDDLRLLERAFGKLKFVYLYREDVIAQAISLYRAEYTGYWHSSEGETPKQQPPYKFGEIKSRVDMLKQHNEAWEAWFRAVDIEPLKVSYEELSSDPIKATEEVLCFLEIDLPTHVKLEASNQRLAGKTTHMWMKRFIEDSKVAR